MNTKECHLQQPELNVKMKLQDTLTESERILDISKKIRIYLCGVTVYDESHIGHARTIIVFDVLRRYLEDKGIKIEFVQNFTDVDDKIINRAKREMLPQQKRLVQSTLIIILMILTVLMSKEPPIIQKQLITSRHNQIY